MTWALSRPWAAAGVAAASWRDAAISSTVASVDSQRLYPALAAAAGLAAQVTLMLIGV